MAVLDKHGRIRSLSKKSHNQQLAMPSPPRTNGIGLRHSLSSPWGVDVSVSGKEGESPSSEECMKCVTSSKTRILDLPEEIIRHIFLYLTEPEIFWNFGFSCRQIFWISLDYIDSIETPIILANSDEDKTRFENCVKCMHHIQNLLSTISRVILCRSWEKEKVLTDTKCIAKACDAKNKGGVAKNKDTIIIRQDSGRKRSWFDMMFCNLVIKFTALEHLYLHNIAEYQVCKVTNNCKALKSLFLQDVKISDTTARVIGENCRSLNVLKCNAQLLTDTGLINLATNMLDLKQLHLADCNQISDVGLQFIAKYCKLLMTLILEGCHLISSVGVETISTNCNRLEELELTGMKELSDQGLMAIGTSCTNLTSLTLGSCGKVSPRGVEALCSLNTKSLEKLCFIECNPFMNTAFQHLVKCLSNLKSLELGCNSLTDEEAKIIALNCNALTTLDLGKCYYITNEGAICIAENCKQLKILRLVSCKSLTDAALKSLSMNCKNLDTVILRFCHVITDNGIMYLVQRCQLLQKIDISGIPKITNEGMYAIAKYSENLVVLNILGCEQITEEGISAVKSSCKMLNNLPHT